MRYFKKCSLGFTCLLLALLAPIAVSAGVGSSLIWPGPAPCNTTLQACINAAAAGDRIEIVQTASIDENISISKSLSLVGTTSFNGITGAPVYYGQFAAGRAINVSSLPSTGTVTVIIDGLVINNAGVTANYSGSGTLNVTVRNLLIKSPGVNGNRIRVDQLSGSTGTLNARIERNTLELDNITSSAQGIQAFNISSTGTFNVEIFENRVHTLRSQGSPGIAVYASEGAAATAKIWANEVRGEFFAGAIAFQESLFGTTASNLTAHVYSNVLVGDKGLGTGFSLVHRNGTVDADFINNSVTNQEYGIISSRFAGGAGGGLIGMHANNLIANNSVAGIALNPEHMATISNRNNLLWANASNQFTAHASTITANPQLIHRAYPWVRAGSPAIDAGDTALGGLGAVFAGIPYLAADGLRRQKGSGLDIGAYEYGDVSFNHSTSSANTSGHISAINHPTTNGNSSARLQVTQQFDGGASPDNSYGMYYTAGQWNIFNQVISTPMLLGVRFLIFSPDDALGSFVHAAKTTPTNNIVGWSTLIDNSATNDQPDEIVLVSQHWNAPGSGTIYNPHPIGVFYLSLGSGKWFITNLDQTPGQDMPHNAGFNVYSQLASKNVYRLTTTNRNRFGGSSVVIDHPLLNGNRCAIPQVTRLLAPSPLTGNFDLYYAPSVSRWVIGQFGNPIADGQQFHVLIDARQIQECAGVMFEDGFE